MRVSFSFYSLDCTSSPWRQRKPTSLLFVSSSYVSQFCANEVSLWLQDSKRPDRVFLKRKVNWLYLYRWIQTPLATINFPINCRQMKSYTILQAYLLDQRPRTWPSSTLCIAFCKRINAKGVPLICSRWNDLLLICTIFWAERKL